MKLFPNGHAMHPQWQVAVDQVLVQLRACMTQDEFASAPSLGLVYITDHFAAHAQGILDHLAESLPLVKQWSGTVGVGIFGNSTEYIDTTALSVMLCDVPPDACRVFSGAAPLGQAKAQGFEPHTALVHADSHTPELSELIVELANSTGSGAVFGGLASSRADAVQMARHPLPAPSPQNPPHQGVYRGGLSGVAFSAQVPLLTRVTQGCQPFGDIHQITSVNEHVVLTLDDAPALYALMQALDVPIDNPRSAVDKVRETLVGLSAVDQGVLRATGGLRDDALVRHIIGLDPVRHGVAVAHWVEEGMQLVFCKRNAASAKADLLRMATEIREALEPQEADTDLPSSPPRQGRRIAGAVYISCTGRGGPHFGAPNAELHVIRRALGDIPLVGFMAAGEIAHQHIYGYSGVLTVFMAG